VSKVSKNTTKTANVGGSDSSFLPDFCSIRMVFATVITAELFALVLSLSSIQSVDQLVDEISLKSLSVQWIALLGAGLLCLLRRPMKGFSDRLVGVLSWLLLQLLTLIFAVVALKVLWIQDGADFVIRTMGISAIVSALVLRYLYIQHLWRGQVEAESKARFQALQSRIRPHFLFNSMNTIASLTRSSPEDAEEVVQDLSDLFRASLSDQRRHATLGEELELCRGYLRIEERRLGGRLQICWDLQGLPEQAALPRLIFQPLLENAVYHGIEPATEPGTITITGRYRRKQVNISIRNSIPRPGNESPREGNKMALENIRQRLLGFFNDDASLAITNVDGEHQVRVVFPYPWSEK